MAVLALAATAMPALAAWDVASLMAALGKHPAGKARFTETKTLSVLNAPVVSTGELVYSPPDRLEKNTLTPKPESLVVEHDNLVMVRDGRRRELRLQQYPEVLSIVEAVRGTLIGNRGLLEQYYALDLAGSQQGWQLTLKPLDERMKRWVRQIAVVGKAGEITSIETQQMDGDKSVLLIEPER
ncbi:MAG: outer membrane lipoprotein carrier protein LolA [Ottowia sp.]|uniref:LolA-related protein n=2 Tax=Ottowia sp. TaxID=1898956 RepID=UPI001D575B1F|nr:LolA-related protein [Ottowia sp.]MCB2025855.1 outer membrane lipoprotein carrier protein LolA [Ottowia sp.]MCB2069666.1 outer membrane lipoprotein carrier protein LolA [Ottowia sp.]MCP5259679.1 outer membrane lipoprotein carrier protein LolA [Burkholderiaceae bacterium]HPK31382.1 outer membrane lipoprotein carrier protein LolA [Ottowia sp.]